MGWFKRKGFVVISHEELQTRLGQVYRDGFWDGYINEPFLTPYWFSDVSREAAGDLVNGYLGSLPRHRLERARKLCTCPDIRQPIYEI